MEDKEKELVKALKFAIEQKEVSWIGYWNEEYEWIEFPMKDILDLIQRLQENNANQVRMRCDMQRKFDDLQTLCTEQKAEIERLSLIAGIVNKGVAVEIVNMQETIDKQKAEIERLKDENCHDYNCMCLAQQEKAELQKQVDELKEKKLDAYDAGVKRGSKDTAKKYYDAVKELFNKWDCCGCVEDRSAEEWHKDNDKIAREQFGVEV